jgi:hypothetical protein
LAFPYGEGIIFLLTLVTWAQKHPSVRLYLLLSLAWLIGRIIDFLIIGEGSWHINYARLAVILVFWLWSWHKAERCISALILTLLSLLLLDLFLVNEPGILSYEKWIYAGLSLVVAWLTTGSYWGMAAAAAGSVLINQGLIMFFFGGIVSHVSLPDAFIWNTGVAALALLGVIRFVKQGGVKYFY